MLQNDVSGYHKITLHQANILHHTGVLTGALRTFKDRHFLSDERTFTDRSAKVAISCICYKMALVVTVK